MYLLKSAVKFLKKQRGRINSPKLVPFCLFVISMNPEDFRIVVRTLVSRKRFLNSKTE